MAMLINLLYLLASGLFIYGIKGLTKPKTAVRGNRIAASGMLLAIVVALIDRNIISYEWIIIGLLAGVVIGAVLALTVKMTSMPQMVGMLNGFGGIASALVAGAALIEILVETSANPSLQFSIATALTGIIGGVTFTGSMIAFAKLQGLISEKPIQVSNAQFIKIVLILGAILFSVLIVAMPNQHYLYWPLLLVAGALGIILVIPIGGADMPVVISLLNSYSGLAAAATGFVLNNNLLIISGSLVGASGIILTKIMCDAMNRSLANVLFGGMGGVVESIKADDVYAGKVKSASPEEVAMMLETARRVVFVPGYGMAVSQAQHVVRDLTNLLESRGTEVAFAIHPVAGRMPGHMNVLLAEADISYDKLIEMSDINPTFEQTDMSIVIGANDVVNPLARTDPSCPIAGMPILDVDKSRTTVVIKRSLSPGFAGIPNPLFADPKTLMLFGDGKEMIQAILKALKEA